MKYESPSEQGPLTYCSYGYTQVHTDTHTTRGCENSMMRNIPCVRHGWVGPETEVTGKHSSSYGQQSSVILFSQPPRFATMLILQT